MELQSPSIGTPPSQAPVYEALFAFVDDKLPYFKPVSKQHNGKIVEAEDAITADLSEYLDYHQEQLAKFLDEESLNYKNRLFKFTNQSPGNTDIGVKCGRKYGYSSPVFCWIETKRLPTPKNSQRDEREYVIVGDEVINGKRKYNGGGGIQRFKTGKHAPNLPYAIMIGYVQSETFDYWIGSINNWITQLSHTHNSWDNEDLLVSYQSDKCQRYISTHKREKGIRNITLHHFWIPV